MSSPTPLKMPQRLPLRTTVIIDYQNIHLTGWELFGEGKGQLLHDTLVDPMKFARQLIKVRNSGNVHSPNAQLHSVKVFRGMPGATQDPDGYRRSQDQLRNWRSDGADVTFRPLKYRYRLDASGRPITDINGKKTPIGPPEEKGVDLLIGLSALLCAQDPNCGLVILASHDSDMAPIIETVHDLHVATPGQVAAIETASWFIPRTETSSGFQSRVNPGKDSSGKRRHVWNTRLGEPNHLASLDTRTYR